MKFLIIAFHPRTMTPYAKQYENEILKAGYSYDILFWDRFSNGALEKKENEYIFHRICTLGGNRLKKIYPFYLFRKTVKKIIFDGKYDKIIILNTMPGFLLHDILLKKYKNKYILDIRDYTYEKYTFYLNTVENLINNSFFTAISSRGFQRFLGKNKKLVVNHNISNLGDILQNPTLHRDKQVLTIGFVGAIRYFDENIALINSFANKDNMNFIFAGRELSDCPLKEYCSQKEYTNVSFSGAFKNEEKTEIYRKIDIINSLYGNKAIEVQSLLPNRLYDSLIFKKPILTTRGTYLSEVVEKWGIGLSLEGSQDYNQEDYQKNIYEYVDNFDENSFVTNANNLLKVVEKEQQYFHNRIADFVEA